MRKDELTLIWSTGGPWKKGDSHIVIKKN